MTKVLMSKAVTKKHVVAVITVVLVLATISSAFALQQLANQENTNPKDIIQTDTLSPLNETTPTATIEPTPTPKPSPSPTSSLIPIPVDFTIPVGLTIKGTSNVFTVNVDLNDGMSRDEAITVAETILNRELTNTLHELKSAEVNNEGIWNINFSWEYASFFTPRTDLPYPTETTSIPITPVLGHFFDVVINPQNLTATYTRCM